MDGSHGGRFALDFMQRSDYEDYARLNSAVFSGGQNPVLKALEISPDDWHRFEMWDAEGILDSGFSMVVRDTHKGNRLAAFLVVQRFSFVRELPPLARLGIKEPKKIETFLETTGAAVAKAYAGRFYSGCLAAFSGRTLRVCAGGTDAAYEGLKLQLWLRTQLLSLAAERGIDRVVVETIHPATEHLWSNHFGFHVLGQSPWRTSKDPRLAQVDGRVCVLEKVLRRRSSDLGCLCPLLGLWAVARSLGATAAALVTSPPVMDAQPI